MISQIMKPTPPIKSDQEGLSPSNDLHANDANNNPIEFKFKKLEFDIEELYSNQYSSFLHIPLPNAINRVDNGSLIIGELCKIFQGRVDMEDKELGYSTRVSRPNLYENEIRYSTSERALGFLKNYYLYLSKDQSHFRRQFDEEIVFQLDNYKTIRSNDITKHKLEIDKIHDEIKYHEDYLNKLKKQLLKLLEDVYHGKEKLIILNRAVEEFLLTKVANESAKKDYNTSKDKVIGRILSAFDNNPITDKEKLLKKLEKLDHEVMNKMAEIASKKKVLLDCILRRDEVYKKALKSFEMAEKGRLMHTKNVLKKFVELEKNALENRLKLLHAFEEGALTSLDDEADIRLYVSKEKNIENTQRYATSLQIMDWDYSLRYTRDRKLSVMTDISGPQNIPPNEPSAETNIEGESPVTDQQPAEIPNPSPTPDDWKSDPPTTDEPTLQTSSNELPDGATPEITRGNRSPTLSSTSSAVTKSSTPITQKYVTELIESHIFLDSSSKNHPSEHSDGTLTDVEELCGRAFADQYGMDLFLQVLDEKRGRCAELEVLGFHNMKVAMKIFLDRCSELHDVKSALRIANMSITFHMKYEESENLQSDDDVSLSERIKHYIQREEDISQHQLWNKDGFWEDALMIGLKAQLDMMDPVLWDELDTEMLKEKVLALHNMIFGQLGTLAFTMHEMGLPKQEVEKLVLSLSEGAQLGEDQQLELLKSIRVTYSRHNHIYHSREKSNSTLSSLGQEEHDQDHPRNEENNLEQGHSTDPVDAQPPEQEDILNDVIEANNADS